MGGKLDSARAAFSQAVERWESSKEWALVAPVACVIHEAIFLTRYVSLLPSGYDPASLWLLIGCVVAILGCVFLRKRYPLGALLVACVCAAVCAHVDRGAYTGVPLLVLLYGVIARADYARAVVATVATVAAFWAPVYFAGEKTLALVHLEWLLAIATLALVSRALWTRRQAARELQEERGAREQALRERDAAEARSRIAGELHDSVGHDLTAIIALSEGLMGAAEDEAFEAAVASINSLAREGLVDTRRAVRQISALHGTGVVAETFGKTRSWDSIRPVLEHARSTGLTVAFTETGVRSCDSGQAELVFSVTREAVTNVLRHARHASRITVSWDHATDGSCLVTVRDDGASKEAVGTAGTGITRMRERVEAAGGMLFAGPSSDGGWEVRASVTRVGVVPGAKEGDGS